MANMKYFLVIAILVFIAITCFWCLSPIFSSITTAFNFLWQYIAFTILYNAVEYIYNCIKKELDNTNNKENNNLKKFNNYENKK